MSITIHYVLEQWTELPDGERWVGCFASDFIPRTVLESDEYEPDLLGTNRDKFAALGWLKEDCGAFYGLRGSPAGMSDLTRKLLGQHDECIRSLTWLSVEEMADIIDACASEQNAAKWNEQKSLGCDVPEFEGSRRVVMWWTY